VDALIAAGVGRVVAALEDPNPRVSGRGFAALRAAGIEVEVGLMAEEAGALNAGFISRMRRGRPRVTVKLGASLDGRTAMASGESQWITGAAARQDVQRLRAMSCAIVTGAGTVLADDCALTVRAAELGMKPADAARASARQPLRVVLDSGLQAPVDARIFSEDAPTLWCCGEEKAPLPAPPGATTELLPLARTDSGLDLQALLAELNRRQCNEILVESGPRLAGALLQLGLLDELIVYMAPTLLGSAARPLLELPLTQMAQQLPLTLIDVRRVGDDWRFTAVPRH
jgi:diaminohydroxyphosphoribosylaminopyrimidine deaminase/5-amino-6-(5-phosphoribosylamino)uracil reductase